MQGNLSKMIFFLISVPTWNNAMTVANVHSGFMFSGIWPVNRYANLNNAFTLSNALVTMVF